MIARPPLTHANGRSIVICIRCSNWKQSFALAASGISKTRRSYLSHRERQNRRILDAAARLFDERGIDRVTMADIVSATGIRASTMYQYFSTKDDVVWTILGELFADSAVRAKRAMEAGTSALDKIAALLEFMADGLTNDPAKVRFVAQFDAMYARHWPVERLLSLEARISPQGFESFSALIREGMADGSLRPDLDPGLTMHAVINAVIGAQRRLASLGDRVELEYGKPIDVLFREIIRIILLGLRATGPAVAPNIRRPSQPKRKRHS
jgi:AcrR family transcriptional regulator